MPSKYITVIDKDPLWMNENTIYRKIPLIRPGRIYGQRTNLMDLYSGGGGLVYGGGFIFGRKNNSICDLLNLLLFFLFPV